MVARTLQVIDNEFLTVDSSSPTLTAGSAIINNSDTPDGTIFTYAGGPMVDVTLDDTGGSADVFEDDDTAGHVITDGGGLVANGNGVEAESNIYVRALDDTGNETGPTITVTVFSQNGVFQDIWGFATDIPLAPGTSYVKTSGSNLGNADYKSFVTCFGPTTSIRTPDGPLLVGDLAVGQMVWTRAHGNQPLRWVAHSRVAATGANAPVVFAPGALGNADELVVSQQHRMFFHNPLAELMFASPGVLVPARFLLGLAGVSLRPTPRLTYTHFLFDSHRIVEAGGALCESFHAAAGAVRALDTGPRAELLRLFPELARKPLSHGPTAAMVLNRRESLAFAAALRGTDFARAA